MPWRTDENGNDVFVLSTYAKEELPTWNEIYEVWYKDKMFHYDPDDPNDQEPDVYWKIPRKQYLIAVICNQFNKMLYEDGKMDALKQLLFDEGIVPTDHQIEDISFIAENGIDENLPRFLKNHNIGDPNKLPPIYVFPMPDGSRNPFIINNHPRIDITTVPGLIGVQPVISSTFNGDDGAYKLTDDQYDTIIDFMVRPMMMYFEGDCVGWKDKDGNVITANESINADRVIHYPDDDPAL